ncbi:MAG: tetratricopeptide repeat protein, partial [Calditrichaeota bacterium]
MKAKENFSLALLLLLCLPFVLPVRLSAQARNPRAENWFRTGVEERDSQKKIEAYLKAIEYEPLFVEALFNVGVLYRQAGKFDLAETYLRRAYEAKPNDPTNKIRPKILLNLAAVQRQLGKLPDAEATLHRAERVAVDRKTRSKVAFELGRVLYEQQKYQEALGVLQDGKTLDRTTQSFFSNLIQIVQKEMQVQRLYRQAQQAIARGDLAAAKAVNTKIKALKPTFSRLDEQIAHLDSVTKTRAEKEFLQDLYNLAKQHTAAGNIVQAINTYELIEQKHPNFMDVRTKLQDLRKLQSKKPAEKTLEENYTLGVQALKAKNWTGAIIALEKVKAVDPNYLKV